MLPFPVPAEQQSYDEFALKTAFLYRALYYIEWPESSDNKVEIPLTICVTTNNAFSDTIKSLHLQSIVQRKIIVKQFDQYTDMHECQVVYISKNNEKIALDLFMDENILTVGDYPGFIEAGGILNFPIHKNKVTIEINNRAAEEHNLKISAKLLRIAIVKNN
jgi:hypothetical protein